MFNIVFMQDKKGQKEKVDIDKINMETNNSNIIELTYQTYQNFFHELFLFFLFPTYFQVKYIFTNN